MRTDTRKGVSNARAEPVRGTKTGPRPRPLTGSLARSQAALALTLAVVCATWACVGPSAPEPINHAIQVIARHLPAYVAEANRVLAESDHPDKDRLIGTGERLVAAVEALDRWAGSGDTDGSPPGATAASPGGGQ